jgi:hypothetical protein
LALRGSDQHFSAVLLNFDQDSCVNIVRLEGCNFREIAWALIDILSGVPLPSKSTILIGSVSHIASKGVQSFGEDLVKSLRQLSDKLPENLSFSVLVPAIVNGINSQRAARNIAEMECWIQALKGPDGALMRRTRELFLGQMELQHVLG